MLKKYLEEISKIKINLIGQVKVEGKKMINTVIFKNDFNSDVKKYKAIFYKKLEKKRKNLLSIYEEIFGLLS